MKKIITICFLALLLISNPGKSQTITAQANTIETLLCKKWTIDYALMGGVRQEDIEADRKDISFNFRKNKTFSMSMGEKSADKGEGTWLYDPSKKVVKLIMHGKVGMIITDLTTTALIMKFNDKTGMKEDNLQIEMVYKVMKN